MSFDREKLIIDVAKLAASGVLIGTSSWKYQGWLGQLYAPERYMYRGKVAESRFEKNCLSEYAEVFKTVCFDGAHYRFYNQEYYEKLAAQVPNDFRFGFKIPDAITIKKYPNHARHGPMAGKMNPDFLNADRFAAEFLKPCEAIREQVGILMFEFSTFHRPLYEHGAEFIADLENFFSHLPSGWPYAVELRNHKWLQAEYFQGLARHNVAHVFNSWDTMPPVSEQLALEGSFTTPSLAGARFLLTPGRDYKTAVAKFEPYDKIKEVNEEARKAAAALIKNRKKTLNGKTYIFVNNRLEGNALQTIRAILDLAALDG